MTSPTKEQLAPNIDPALRDYIDLCISEAIVKARLAYKMKSEAMDTLNAAVAQRLVESEQFETLVRGHLGIGR